MTASLARTWLRSRIPLQPEPLVRRMEAALAATPARAEDVGVHLAEAGLRCLREALDGGGSRAAAFDLLTADALLTSACEAAAEQGAAALDALTAAYGPARFAALLEAEA
ncbi:MAG: hypothetical protein ACRELX_15075 [Longimicrobiales bacterium]